MHKSILELVKVVTFKIITLPVKTYACLLQYYGKYIRSVYAPHILIF